METTMQQRRFDWTGKMIIRTPETPEYEGWSLPKKAYKSSQYHYFVKWGHGRWVSLCQQHGWGMMFVPEDQDIHPNRVCPVCERFLTVRQAGRSLGWRE